MNRRSVYVATWGCQMNEYDSKRLLELLHAELGLEAARSPEEADVLILNTCSIREKAQEKLFHQLGRWRALKARSGSLIAVGGCVATQEGEAIRARAPYVDLLFGPQSLHRLPRMIEAAWKGDASVERTDLAFSEIEKFDALPEQKANGVVASVTIMEGCDKFCAYCIVPYTRGGEVCRPMQAVIKEVQGLLNQGVKEILLLGQNVNAWRERDPEGKLWVFSDLLRAIAALPELVRLRFLTSHPIEFTQDLIDLYSELPKLPSSLHLPVQSGSDKVLSLMGRGHTVLEYKSILKKLKKVRPDILFSSDFIVGFPGESESDFLQTMELIHQIAFDVSYSFVFSKRPGTPAAGLPDETPLSLKQERLKRLQAALSKSVLSRTRSLIGEVSEILIENSVEEAGLKLWTGRTGQNRWVYLPDAPGLHLGALVQVRLKAIKGSYLLGESL